ncbi:cell division protein FtsA [Candidatus Symbiobacter mobilis]|uniref:Cell division protein FtsA n=1 Tax=Candidatus Symbiobacter mobilis CR TaxID=946483 RepID=U5N652_9BURK|nr:cell division protein FtsA [Candidatus Symbiobacter mobilis]AGX86986.1 cell division protein FtsA [Candidatus Symbiobacter mobilis CR]
MGSDNKELLTALDVGTSQVRCVVAQLAQERDGAAQAYEVLGVGTAPCSGVRQGVVNDMDATVDAIHNATNGAVAACGCDVTRVVVGISGSHLRFGNGNGSSHLPHQEVLQSDVDHVVHIASLIGLPEETDQLYVEPQEFGVQQGWVRHPVGMTTSWIDAHVHVVTGLHVHIEDLRRCVLRSGIEVQCIIPASRASSASVLTADEREHGVILLDVGAGTTDIAVFADGALRCTGVIPIGGNLVTSDIVQVVHTQTIDAERLKIEEGYALRTLPGVDGTQLLAVPGIGGSASRMIERDYLAMVIEARWREIFLLVLMWLGEAECELAKTMGVVLTGGSCLTPGVAALCSQVMHVQSVRLGAPSYDGLYADVVNNPGFATAMGLLDVGMQKRFMPRRTASQQQWPGKLKSLWSDAMDWLHGEG